MTEQHDRKALLKEAVAAVERLQARVDANERAQREPIAIVGIGCRLPGGVDSPEAFWRVLRDGIDVVTDVPADRWDVDAYYDPNRQAPGTMCTRRGGFLSGVDGFDPAFFGIAPREAVSLDPQQRLLLEVTWEALERAGHAPDRLAGSLTGVFVGLTTLDYATLIDFSDPKHTDVYAATGNAMNTAAGRLSFTLGLQGPCMAIDTACSSSLVALHQACVSLRTRESNMAIAAGVNLALIPETFVLFSRWGMLAPDGRCKTFDAAADGFVRGEGCIAVVLKRLSDAIADGDHIDALIRGSAVNQDGRSSGLTVPNGPAQQAVIRQALTAAGVRPAEVTYVEAHGTGTPLGDPIEIEAIANVFDADRSSPLLVGSVKTNIGHTEAVAGLAGLLKVVLSLEQETIAKTLHFEQPNPRIPWNDIKVRVAAESLPWQRGEQRRIAGISSFGFSGTNAHAILEEAPALARPSDDAAAPQVIVLSARTASGLQQLAGRYAAHFAGAPSSLVDGCFTANTGRSHFDHRLAVLASTPSEMAERLTAFARGDGTARVIAGHASEGGAIRVACLFTGQGAQYPGMGRRLYDTEPVFRGAIDRCADLLADELPLLEVLYGASTDLLDQTRYTQPALFALEYALSELWKSWGLVPHAVLGHSVGEYVAACVAGVMDLESSLRLIAARGRLMQSLPDGGSMVAVFTSEDVVKAALEAAPGDVGIAAVNGPEAIVISGRQAHVQRVVDLLAAQGISGKRLSVSHAFHSVLMEPMLDEFERLAATIAYRNPQLRLISNETGRVVRPGDINAAYWRRHVRAAVQFSASIQEAVAQGCNTFLELGPSPTLVGLGRRIVNGPTWTNALRQGRDDREETLAAAATLFTRGASLNWARITPGCRVTLPTYPFERQRYWVNQPGKARSATAAVAASDHPLLGASVAVAASRGTYVRETVLDMDRVAFLLDHRVQGVPVFPATAYIEMVLGATSEAFGDAPTAIRDIDYKKPLFLQGGPRRLQMSLAGTPDDLRFTVHSRPVEDAGDQGWTLHATGRITRGAAVQPTADVVPPAALRERCPEPVSGRDFYEKLARRGNDWGPFFQGLTRVWRGNREAVSEVAVQPALKADVPRYYFHPAVSDACGHVLSATIPLEPSANRRGGAFVGGSIEEVRVFQRPSGDRLHATAALRDDDPSSPNVLYGDVRVFDETGALISETLGVRLWYVDPDVEKTAVSLDDAFFEPRWEKRQATSGGGRIGSTEGVWLVLARDEVAQCIRHELERAAPRVVTVAADTTCARIAADAFAARPQEAADFGLILDTLRDEGVNRLAGVIDLWTADMGGGIDAATDACAHVLHLVHEITARAFALPPRLWLVTRGAQPAGAGGVVNPAGAAVWGFGRTIAGEHTDIWGGLIDLDPAMSPLDQLALVASEVLGPDEEDHVAYRSSERFVLRLSRRAVSAETAAPAFRPDGAYLITGGCGGLGLAVAAWMASAGARRVILMGRTPLPPRDLWSAQTGPMAEVTRAILALEHAGATVQCEAVDVSDEGQFAAFLERYRREQRPRIRGVVHAAGVMQYEGLPQHDAASMRRIMSAKVRGAWLLHDGLAAEPLDFFVMFSSASALLSSPMLGSYAAGNAFLDAFAHYRRALGRPALSIDWGAWSDVGIAARFAGGDRKRAPIGQSLTPDDGITALARLMNSGVTQCAVMPVDWQQWAAAYPAFAAAPLLRELVGQPAAGAAGAPAAPSSSATAVLRASGADRETMMRGYLAEAVGAVIGVAPQAMDHRTPLTAMGLDSLMAVELKTRLELELQLRIGIVQLLQGPTITELCGVLLPQLEASAVAAVAEHALAAAGTGVEGLAFEEGEI